MAKKFQTPPWASSPLHTVRLTATEGHDQVALIPLGGRSCYVLGRSPDLADVEVRDHPTISRAHCVICHCRGQTALPGIDPGTLAVLLDLNSANGTFYARRGMGLLEWERAKPKDPIALYDGFKFKLGESARVYTVQGLSKAAAAAAGGAKAANGVGQAQAKDGEGSPSRAGKRGRLELEGGPKPEGSQYKSKWGGRPGGAEVLVGAPSLPMDAAARKKLLWGDKNTAPVEDKKASNWAAAASSLGDEEQAAKFMKLMGAKDVPIAAPAVQAPAEVGGEPAVGGEAHRQVLDDLERQYDRSRMQQNFKQRMGLGR